LFTSHGPAFTQSFQRTIEIVPVADAGLILGMGGRISSGMTLALPLGYSLSDTDGSEVASVQVRGIPQGMRITDGVQSYLSGDPLAWVDLSNWNVSALKLDTQGGQSGSYTFTYRLTTTELGNGSAAMIETTVNVDVDAVLPPVIEQTVEVRNETPRISESSSRSTKDTRVAEIVSEAIQATQIASEATTTEPSTAELVGAIIVEAGGVEFAQDDQLARDFEALQQPSLRSFDLISKLDSTTQTFEFQQEDSRGTDIADSTQIATSNPDMEYRSTSEHAGVSEEQLGEQSEVEQETQRNVTLQGRVVAFWNMLRSGVLSQDSGVRQDVRIETRSGQRSGKQE
jgi:hypothetical protein